MCGVVVSAAGNVVDTAGWRREEHLCIEKEICAYQRIRKRIDFGKIVGQITCALAGIFRAERGLGMIVIVKQAAKYGLAYCIALALQTVNVAAEQQSKRLQA